MELKIRIYNDRFAFEEKLHFEIEDIYDLQIKQYWEQAEPINCRIKDLPRNHPAYGWIENFAQGPNYLDIKFTHIEFSKKINENFTGFIFNSYLPKIEKPEISGVDGEIMERYAAKKVNPNFYGKITIEGDVSGDATDFENLVDG